MPVDKESKSAGEDPKNAPKVEDKKKTEEEDKNKQKDDNKETETKKKDDKKEPVKKDDKKDDKKEPPKKDVKKDDKKEPLKKDIKKDEKKEPPKKDDKKEPLKKDEKKEPPKKDDKKEPLKRDEKKEPPKKDDKKEPLKKDEKKEPPKKDDKKEPLKKDEKKEPPKKDDKKDLKKDPKKEPLKKDDKKDDKKEVKKEEPNKTPEKKDDKMDSKKEVKKDTEKEPAKDDKKVNNKETTKETPKNEEEGTKKNVDKKEDTKEGEKKKEKENDKIETKSEVKKDDKETEKKEETKKTDDKKDEKKESKDNEEMKNGPSDEATKLVEAKTVEVTTKLKDDTAVTITDEKTPEGGDAPDKPTSLSFEGLNARLSFAVAAAALGSAFQHGYNLGVINAPLVLMGEWLNETSYNRTEEYLTDTGETMIISWIVSIYCIGGMIGGAFTGFFSERFGRKGGLLLNNFFAILASIFFGFCKMAGSWEMIILGRFIIGINNGLNAGLAPMYLSEIAPMNLRGAIGTSYQLVVTISILFSQIMGLESLLGTEDLWPILLALTVLPAIFQLLTLPICPESPKFLLINKEQRVDAQRALSWLRDSTNVDEEMEEIQNEAEAQKLVPKVSVREICTNPALRIPLIISIMMMLAQQFSGINAAIFFSVKIYESAGLNENEALYATIAMGSMNVLMTVVSLVLVEKAGRKTLMLTGMTGMMVDTMLLTICLVLQSESARWLSYASIVLVILFVVMFATGPGSIPWFLVNELFASNARPTASSIAVAVNWTAAFLVGVGFLPIQQALGPYVFLVFTGLLGLFIIFIVKKVPETRGKSIDEITAVFKQQAYGGVGNRV